MFEYVLVYDKDTHTTYVSIYVIKPKSSDEDEPVVRAEDISFMQHDRYTMLSMLMAEPAVPEPLLSAVEHGTYIVGIPVPMIDEIETTDEWEHLSITNAINNTLRYLDQHHTILGVSLRSSATCNISRTNEGILFLLTERPLSNTHEMPTYNIVWLLEIGGIGYTTLTDNTVLYFEAMIQDGRDQWLTGEGTVTVIDDTEDTLRVAYTHDGTPHTALRFSASTTDSALALALRNNSAVIGHQSLLLTQQYGHLTPTMCSMLLGDDVAVIVPTGE
jgi:hypothetical protein